MRGLAWISLLVVISVCHGAEGPGAVKVLCMGATAPWLNPIPSWGRIEPTLELTLIPSTVPVGGTATPQIETGRRGMRIYFPRTYGQLIEQDFLVFEHMFMEFFTPAQLSDMHDSVEVQGLGGFVTIGGVTHTSAEPNYAWINSPLNDAFPSQASEEVFVQWKQYGAQSGRVKVNEDGGLPPVLTMLIPLGIDEIRQQTIYFMAEKEGSRVWARSMDGKGDPPFLISWTYGRGETWSNSLGMGYAWWRLQDPELGGNPFALDAFMNILLYSTGRELPVDIFKVHEARAGLMDYEESRGWVASLIEFADRFGANTRRVWADLGEVGVIRDAAAERYLVQDYEEALGYLDDAKNALNGIADQAMELKDRALLWTYIIEWLAVLATLIISGEVLYAVMIRRRLYHSVGLTRIR
jgi:hypothetical protein